MPTARETVTQASARLRDAIRAARSRINHRERPSDAYTMGVAKAALGDRRSKCIEHITALVVDVAQRGSLEDAESIAIALRQVARDAFHRTHPARTESYADAWQHESAAQHRVDACERAFAMDPSESNEFRYVAAQAVYVVAQERLHDAMRREVARRTSSRPVAVTELRA